METKVLDHGYVKLVESWGSDERIIESARMSTNKGFQGWGKWVCEYCEESFSSKEPLICSTCQSNTFYWHTGDEKLLRFLYTNHHDTPFEMAGATFEVQAPIFAFREWHRHRTQSFNEMSGRYTELPDLYYVPSIKRLQAAKQSTKNKQGSEEGFSVDFSTGTQKEIELAYRAARGVYEALLAQGVAREVARMVLPVAQYSRMRASANLRNWLAFLRLRLPENAQWEIRQYAKIVAKELCALFPRTMELFAEEMNVPKG